MIEIEQGTGKYVTIAADEETALRWSGDIGFKMMQYNQIRGVLPISQQYIDERLHVYYEVNKMQTLESVYAEAGLSVDKALKILLSLPADLLFLLPKTSVWLIRMHYYWRMQPLKL